MHRTSPVGFLKIMMVPLLLALAVAGCGKSEPAVKVGFARQEIYSAGKINPEYSVHDTVYAGVLWVIDGDREFGIVSLDMMEFPASQSAAIRRSISDSLGIDDIRITVCPSHNHSGLEYDEQALARRVGSVARAARRAARPASVGFCRADAGSGFVVNRRVHVNDRFGDLSMSYTRNNKLVDGGSRVDARGQVVDFIAHGAPILAPSYANNGVPNSEDMTGVSQESRALVESLPERMILDGPVDPHLDALVFKDMSGAVIGTLLRFSCHATAFRSSWAKAYSADFPGVLCAAVSRATGAPAQFLQGPCGDTKPMTVGYGEQQINYIGSGLAELIIPEIEQVQCAPLDSAYWARDEVEFESAPDMLEINDEIRAEAEQRVARLTSGPFDPYEYKQAYDWSTRTWASNYAVQSPTVDLPFTLIGFNEVAVVNMPGEIFAELGMNLKSRYPERDIMVVELVDENTPLYVPTRDEYPMGGYEASNSALPAGSGERMVEICDGMLKGFYR